MKYKLIKEYPGSEKLGTTEWNDKLVYGSHGCSSNWKGTIFYDAHPEFWQRVEEVDYDILSVIGKEGTVISKENYTFPECFQTLVNAKNPFDIFSVKRLSDGEVFNIKDFTTKGVIHKFEITPSHLSVSVGDQKTLLRTFDKIKKTPLFTTEDGVDIFIGSSVYPVSDDFKLLYTSFVKERDKNIRCFSTKEKAEEYIITHKPCLSIKDIFNSKELNLSNAERARIKIVLEEIVKNKL
ncbi:MAG: hypothetical protein H7Y10_03740 [Flavobacterium sp.]|nr:hypothetical protein [Flavobacterium sp.]